MPNRIQLAVALVALTLLLASRPSLAQGKLAIYGVCPGMTAAQVEKTLGPAQIQQKNPPVWRYHRERQGVRGQDDPAVHFDSSSRVRFVTGSRLNRAGNEVLRRGATIPEMKAALGEPSASQPGQGHSFLYVYGPHKLTAVVAGNPARVVVFGLGDEPTP